MNHSPPNDTRRESPWAVYEPTDDVPWDLSRVVHLHRRAGFGATWAEIERDLADGPRKAVERVLGWRKPPASERNLEASTTTADFQRMVAIIGDAALASNNPNRLKAWWIYRMLFTPDPLTERLALMWHNHFATSNLKLEDLAAMRAQNETFRRLATAPFDELLSELLRDPALLKWLDADRNVKGRPNENLARELLELFTLGTGNYTEQDVKETARALTGLAVVRGEATFRPERHDDGQKTILGRTGRFSPDDLVEILAGDPATSRRLAWRIANTFCGEGVVSEAAIDALASGLRQQNLDVGWAVSTVLRSQTFFSDANIGTRVAGPVEFVLAPVRALELFDPPPSTLILAEWCTRLGQDLLYPPNVGGWSEGRAWLSTRTLIGRANFGAALAAGRLNAPPEPPDIALLVPRTDDHDNVAAAVDHLNDLLLGGRLNEAAQDEISAAINESSADNDSQLRHAVALLLARPEVQQT